MKIKLKDVQVGMYIKYLFSIDVDNKSKEHNGHYISYCFDGLVLKNGAKTMEAMDVYLFDDVKRKIPQERISISLDESHIYYNQYSEVEVLWQFQLPDGVSDPNIIKEKFFEQHPEYKI